MFLISAYGFRGQPPKMGQAVGYLEKVFQGGRICRGQVFFVRRLQHPLVAGDQNEPADASAEQQSLGQNERIGRCQGMSLDQFQSKLEMIVREPDFSAAVPVVR